MYRKYPLAHLPWTERGKLPRIARDRIIVCFIVNTPPIFVDIHHHFLPGHLARFPSTLFPFGRLSSRPRLACSSPRIPADSLYAPENGPRRPHCYSNRYFCVFSISRRFPILAATAGRSAHKIRPLRGRRFNGRPLRVALKSVC